MTEPIWRTSSYSERLNCVEVAVLPGTTLVRDSKNRRGDHLTLTSHQWQTFLVRLRRCKDSTLE